MGNDNWSVEGILMRLFFSPDEDSSFSRKSNEYLTADLTLIQHSSELGYSFCKIFPINLT